MLHVASINFSHLLLVTRGVSQSFEGGGGGALTMTMTTCMTCAIKICIAIIANIVESSSAAQWIGCLP